MPGLVQGPLAADLLVGGKSNLTYRVHDGGSTWVVRRPPLGELLSTAHDMAREFRVMSALAASDVPVPKMVTLCADATVLGTPFFVMEWVDGVCYRRREMLEGTGPGRAATISANMVETLATLHQVDAASVGLDDLGRPHGFAARQVDRWKRQFDAARSRDIAGADTLFERLRDRVPTQARTALIHGDYRLDNLLIDTDDTLRAVIDWEMATLGDPLTDVATLVVYGRLARTGSTAVPNQSVAEGYIEESELLGRYESSTATSLGDIDFYLGLANFKLAAILESIHMRFLRGETVGEGFDSAGSAVDWLIGKGLEALSIKD
ncbi:phosphotransferase family protein [soil metagenome]